MIYKETIKTELRRLIAEVEDHWYYLDNDEQALGYKLALEDLLKFIDTIQEEHVSGPTATETVR